jgi:hypothetical protein
MKDLKTLFLEAKHLMWAIICDSVRPWANLGSFNSGRRIELGTVASMRAPMESKPQILAIRSCSADVALMWRRGKVSLGSRACAEIPRRGEYSLGIVGREIPRGSPTFLLEPRRI